MFGSVHDFFHSGTWAAIRTLALVFVLVFWLATIYWVWKDARRRVEHVVAEHNASLAGDSPLRLQLSIGAAEFTGGEELDAAVQRADAAMYDEKSRHRLRRSALEPAPEAA